jgi:trk system potassium uptake protein TrkA
MYVIIVGCGRIGSELAKILSNEKHNVVVIDKNPRVFESLGKNFNGFTFVGNGFDIELLKLAGIEKADALCAVTNSDNVNLIAAQAAKKIFNIKKVIARVYNPNRANIYRVLGLDIISGVNLVAAMIRDKIVESRSSSFLIETAELAMLEIRAEKKIINKKIKEINIPNELLIAAINRKKQSIIPEQDTEIQEGDILIGVVKISSLEKIKKIYNL